MLTVYDDNFVFDKQQDAGCTSERGRYTRLPPSLFVMLIFVCVCVCVYIYIYIYTYIYVHIYTHTHTHTHVIYSKMTIFT